MTSYKTKTCPVGIDNYSLHPLDLSPEETLDWAVENGCEGAAFSGLTPDQYAELSVERLKDLSARAGDQGLYLEWGGGRHIPCDMETWEKMDIFSTNLERAREAAAMGVEIIRSCSGGLMRWQADSPPTQELMRITAEALKKQRGMLADHGVILAIETHFEFTSFELLRIFEMAGLEPGAEVGICLDTMNLLVMLEDPSAAADRLLPWTVSTHIKDGGLLLDEAGLHPFPVEVGSGIVDLPEIIKKIASLDRTVNLSVEDHGGSFDLPVFDQTFLAEFPDLTTGEMTGLMYLALDTKGKLERKDLNITSRKQWPHICSRRVKTDIVQLKKIAQQFR